MVTITRKDMSIAGVSFLYLVGGGALIRIMKENIEENKRQDAIFKENCLQHPHEHSPFFFAEHSIQDLNVFCKENSSTSDFLSAFKGTLIPIGIILTCFGVIGFLYLCYEKNIGHIKTTVKRCSCRN